MPAKLNFFKTPASIRLVSSQTVSTSTGLSGCYQPHRQTAMPGQKSIYETFLVYSQDRSILHIFSWSRISRPIVGLFIAHRRMNVEIGTVAAQFLSCEHLYKIFGFVSVQCRPQCSRDPAPFIREYLEGWSCLTIILKFQNKNIIACKKSTVLRFLRKNTKITFKSQNRRLPKIL
jgi:hypothetical protein